LVDSDCCLCVSEHIQAELGIYDPGDLIDFHCFQTVFVPAVQLTVDIFRDAWNNHHIRNRGVPRRNYLGCLQGGSAVQLLYDDIYAQQVMPPFLLRLTHLGQLFQGEAYGVHAAYDVGFDNHNDNMATLDSWLQEDSGGLPWDRHAHEHMLHAAEHGLQASRDLEPMAYALKLYIEFRTIVKQHLET
jgi:hypothetical protein